MGFYISGHSAIPLSSAQLFSSFENTAFVFWFTLLFWFSPRALISIVFRHTQARKAQEPTCAAPNSSH